MLEKWGTHRFFFVFSTALIVVSLPVSEFGLSLGIIVLSSNWFVEADFLSKWKRLKNNVPALSVLGIYLIHILWLLNTNNLDYALHDIKIKLPLLAFSVVYGSSAEIKPKQKSLILHLYIYSVFAATFLSLLSWKGLWLKGEDFQNSISPFISHIRFSLMIVFAIIVALYLSFEKVERWHYLLLVVWLAIFLLLLKSLTGVIVFVIVLTPLLVWCVKFYKPQVHIKKTLIIVLVPLFVIAFFLSLYIQKEASIYFSRPEININDYPKYTVNGNKYINNTMNKQLENGMYVWHLINWDELEREWGNRSKVSFWGKDDKGQNIYSTTMRYMTSLSLTKDSLGISQLTEEDFLHITKGYTNYKLTNKLSLYPFLERIFTEIMAYKKENNPNGLSFLQRMAFAKNGIYVIKHNVLLGVGTGDVNDEIMLSYKHSNTGLYDKYWFRPHNQYVTFTVAFGLIGLSFVLFFFFVQIRNALAVKNFLLLFFIAITLLSFLNEDTLETHTGASFIAFFLTFLIVAKKNEVTT